MSILWKYKKNFFRFFRICRLEYALKPIVLAITKGKLAFLPKDNSNGEKNSFVNRSIIS